MNKSVLSRIKIIFNFLFSLLLNKQVFLLFLSQRFTIKSDILALKLFNFLFGFFFFVNGEVRALLGELWSLLFIIMRRSEIDFDVSLDNTDLIIRFALNYIDQVISALIIDVNCVSFHQARVVSKFLFKTTSIICIHLT